MGIKMIGNDPCNPNQKAVIQNAAGFLNTAFQGSNQALHEDDYGSITSFCSQLVKNNENLEVNQSASPAVETVI